MSSTNRGAVRNVSDYYVTPIDDICAFLSAWSQDEPDLRNVREILDPCAGGTRSANNGLPLVEMSYPRAIANCPAIFRNVPICTMDIRENSLAHARKDYLTAKGCCADLIISNPPFALAQEFISKALSDVMPSGFVVMLLRLNFFGSDKRKDRLQANMPQRCYVHSKRMGFNRHRLDLPPKQRNAADSIEYMHAVWKQGEHNSHTILKVI